MMPVSSKQVFLTAATAYGIYATGFTVSEYNTNSQTFYDDFSAATSYWSQEWAAYCHDKNGISNALQSCVTNSGIINLQVLADNGFYDSLQDYVEYCIQQGTMETGSSSAGTTTANIFVNGVGFVAEVPEFPDWVITDEAYVNAVSDGLQVVTWRHSYYANDSESYSFRMAPAGQVFTLTEYETYSKLHSSNCYEGSFQILLPSGRLNVHRVRAGYPADADSRWRGGLNPSDSDWYYLNPNYTYTIPTADTISSGTLASFPVVINASVFDNPIPIGTVSPFSPTIEQLSSGYDLTDIEYVELHEITGHILTLENMLPGLKRYDDSFATVATTGDYDDLTNKPDIPSGEIMPSTVVEDRMYLEFTIGNKISNSFFLDPYENDLRSYMQDYWEANGREDKVVSASHGSTYFYIGEHSWYAGPGNSSQILDITGASVTWSFANGDIVITGQNLIDTTPPGSISPMPVPDLWIDVDPNSDAYQYFSVGTVVKIPVPSFMKMYRDSIEKLRESVSSKARISGSSVRDAYISARPEYNQFIQISAKTASTDYILLFTNNGINLYNNTTGVIEHSISWQS